MTKQGLRLEKSGRIVALAILMGLSGCAGEKIVSAQQVIRELTVDQAVRQLAHDLVMRLPEGQKPIVGVVEFTNLSRCVSELGGLVAEQLTTRLSYSDKVGVVERRNLKRVVDELGVSLSSLMDPDTARAVGRLIAANAIVTGTLANRKPLGTVNARLIDLESGRILAAAEAHFRMDWSEMEMLERITGCPKQGSGGNMVRRNDAEDFIQSDPPNRGPAETSSVIAPQKIAPQVLVDQAIHLRPGDSREFPLDASKGETLRIECRSLLPVDVFLLDPTNLEKYRRGERFAAIRGGSAQHLTRGALSVQIGATGQYVLLVATQVTNLMPRRVKIRVESVGTPHSDDEGTQGP